MGNNRNGFGLGPLLIIEMALVLEQGGKSYIPFGEVKFN